MENTYVLTLRDYLLDGADKSVDESTMNSILSKLYVKMSNEEELEVDDYLFLILAFYKKIVDMIYDYIERKDLWAEDLDDDGPYQESVRYKMDAEYEATQASKTFDALYVRGVISHSEAIGLMKKQISSIKDAYERTRKELE